MISIFKIEKQVLSYTAKQNHTILRKYYGKKKKYLKKNGFFVFGFSMENMREKQMYFKII